MGHGHRLIVATIVSGCLLALGCRGTAHVSPESSRLRGEIVELEDRVAQLERRNRELELELQAAETASQLPSEAVRANTPHVTEIAIQRLSFARDTDGDGRPDLLTLYLVPKDGLGRFTQLAGELSASAMLLPAQGEPSVVGQTALGPAEVRDAYRSSVTGTHYTVEIALSLPASNSSKIPEREIFARVQYRDGVSGASLNAERKISLP